jgi:hypothetical protein
VNLFLGQARIVKNEEGKSEKLLLGLLRPDSTYSYELRSVYLGLGRPLKIFTWLIKKVLLLAAILKGESK